MKLIVFWFVYSGVIESLVLIIDNLHDHKSCGQEPEAGFNVTPGSYGYAKKVLG